MMGEFNGGKCWDEDGCERGICYEIEVFGVGSKAVLLLFCQGFDVGIGTGVSLASSASLMFVSNVDVFCFLMGQLAAVALCDSSCM